MTERNNSMDVYEELRQILDAHPTGAPKSEYFDEILKISFTPEEAQIATKMSFSPRGVGHLSEATGIDAGELEEKLEAMCNKMVIFSTDREDGKLYGLLPTIPGLFEFPFMKGGGTPKLDKLGELWEKYHRDAMGAAFGGSDTPLMRVLAVEKSFGAKNKAHPYEEVAHFIEQAEVIALTDCACRVSLGNCDRPRDVCLIFDNPAKFLIDRGYARSIGKEEAMDALDRAEKAGLVHTSNNSSDKANLICNCCPCCCTILRGRTQLDLPNAFATSSFIAKVDADECSGCGTCADERCPMGAVEIVEEIAVVDEKRCIGCGLCVTGCPSSAIYLEDREPSHPVCGSVKEMGMKILMEKGKLEEFIKISKR